MVHEARTAYTAAKSADLHADLRIAPDDQRQVIDIKGAIDGNNQVVVQDRGALGKATRRHVGGATYVNGDKKFWADTSRSTNANSSDRARLAALADKWVNVPTEGNGQQFLELTIGEYLDGVIGPKTLTENDLANATTTKVTYHGRPAYQVKSRTDTFTFDVRTKYLLATEGHQPLPNSTGKSSLTGWNQQPVVEAPPNAFDAR